MKSILIFLLITVSFLSSAQHTDDGKFIYFDTAEVVDYLNGEWKLKLNKKTYKYNFNFDTLTVSCIDSVNLGWYEGTITKYQLHWEGCCRVFLRCHWFDSQSNSFQKKYYPQEIWFIDEKRMAINFDGDFGVYILKKTRR